MSVDVNKVDIVPHFGECAVKQKVSFEIVYTNEQKVVFKKDIRPTKARNVLYEINSLKKVTNTMDGSAVVYLGN
jgi:hypothetical protein